MTTFYKVRYGRDGDRLRYVHSHETDLDEARRVADSWLAGNGWGGWPEGELRVWVEDANGHVVHGREATKEEL